MSTIFKIKGGGQRIRQSIQQIQSGACVIEIEKEEQSNYPELAKCDGQDSYTGELWATDIETVKRWAQDWAGNGVEVVFQIK